jgi:hypothetical protein
VLSRPFRCWALCLVGPCGPLVSFGSDLLVLVVHTPVTYLDWPLIIQSIVLVFLASRLGISLILAGYPLFIVVW